MLEETTILEEKEKKLALFLETCTTEEVLSEVQKHIPSLRSQSNVLSKLNEINLPHPVVNTLIYYILATNKQILATSKLLTLSNLCRKYNIKTAEAAISFFKKYYLCRSQVINQNF